MVLRPWELSTRAENHPAVADIERVLEGVHINRSLKGDRAAEGALLFQLDDTAFRIGEGVELDESLEDYLSS